MVGLHVGDVQASLWMGWNLNPVLMIGLVVAAWLYFRGLALSTGTRRRLHPWWRPISYYSSLVAVFLSLASPIDSLADDLFLMHMAQHMLLMVIAPPLALLGAPMIPILRGIPRSIRRYFVVPILRQKALHLTLKWLTLPLIAWPLYVITLIGWHTPSLYSMAIAQPSIHTLEHVSFVGVALLFWWNIIDSVPLRSSLSYIARVPYVFLMSVPNFILGAFLTFSEAAWYEPYRSQELIWGLSSIEDQQLGGVIMWILGALILLVALLSILTQLIQKEERAQQKREAVTGNSAGLSIH